MKSTMLGLTLGLLGSAAMAGAAVAQTPPATAPKPPAAAAAPTPPAPAPQTPPSPAPQGQQNAQNGQTAIPAPSGPPEGMIVETPNGFYLVRPGDPNPQRLDIGRNGAQPGPGPQPGSGQPGPSQNPGAMAQEDDAMGDMPDGGMAGDGMQPPPPRPHRHPPRPPEGKGARLHIHAPNLDVNVKCPDEEPIKACVDAISQLMDKANAAGH